MSVADDIPAVCTRNCSNDSAVEPCPTCGHSGHFHTINGSRKKSRPCDVCVVQAAEARMSHMVDEMRAMGGKSE